MKNWSCQLKKDGTHKELVLKNLEWCSVAWRDKTKKA